MSSVRADKLTPADDGDGYRVKPRWLQALFNCQGKSRFSHARLCPTCLMLTFCWRCANPLFTSFCCCSTDEAAARLAVVPWPEVQDKMSQYHSNNLSDWVTQLTIVRYMSI